MNYRFTALFTAPIRWEQMDYSHLERLKKNTLYLQYTVLNLVNLRILVSELEVLMSVNLRALVFLKYRLIIYSVDILAILKIAID